MADEDTTQHDDNTPDNQDDDERAQDLLADAVQSGDDQQGESSQGRNHRGTETDTTDWKAEAEKWKRMSRKNEATANAHAKKLKEYDDATKSETERWQETATSATTRAEKAETALRRREIAEERAPEHATVAQIKAVAKRLSGESDEELEADADELFAFLAPKPADPPARVPSKPAERMPRGGGDPDEPPEETDPRKLAALINRGR